MSCSLVIFFSPSNNKNDSNVGGAFIFSAKKIIFDESSLCHGRPSFIGIIMPLNFGKIANFFSHVVVGSVEFSSVSV